METGGAVEASVEDGKAVVPELEEGEVVGRLPVTLEGERVDATEVSLSV